MQAASVGLQIGVRSKTLKSKHRKRTSKNTVLVVCELRFRVPAALYRDALEDGLRFPGMISLPG